MEVKINVGRSKLDAIKIVKETLGISLNAAHAAVNADHFECPNETFMQLNTRLQTEVGGFIEPVSAAVPKNSEVKVKTTVESSLVVSEEWVSFTKENHSLLESVVMGLIGFLKPDVRVQTCQREDKFVSVVLVDVEDQKEVEAAKVLATTLNDFIVESIKEVANFQATFKRDFAEWYYKDDEYES